MRRTIFTLLGALLLIASTAFGDVVVGSATAGWQTWTTAVINQDGNPFWDGNSSDSTSSDNIGNCLTGTGACTMPGAPGTPIPYWGIGTAADPSYYFQGGGGQTVTLLLEIAGNAAGNSFGWYDETNTASRGTIFAGGAAPPTTVLVSVPTNYGFWLSNGTNTFYTQSSLNPTGDKTFQHFATFQQPGPTYWIGIEDELGSGSDKDYQDMVVTVTSVVPEPGTIAIFGVGLLLSGYWIRRRRK